MYRVRLWSVRHARGLNLLYRGLENLLVALRPLAKLVGGGATLERPMAAVERGVKGFMFDCKMCGQCVLSSTGMSCPMNCPKQLRNGPCGGVRAKDVALDADAIPIAAGNLHDRRIADSRQQRTHAHARHVAVRAAAIGGIDGIDVAIKNSRPSIDFIGIS